MKITQTTLVEVYFGEPSLAPVYQGKFLEEIIKNSILDTLSTEGPLLEESVIVRHPGTIDTRGCKIFLKIYLGFEPLSRVNFVEQITKSLIKHFEENLEKKDILIIWTTF